MIGCCAATRPVMHRQDLPDFQSDLLSKLLNNAGGPAAAAGSGMAATGASLAEHIRASWGEGEAGKPVGLIRVMRLTAVFALIMLLMLLFSARSP